MFSVFYSENIPGVKLGFHTHLCPSWAWKTTGAFVSPTFAHHSAAFPGCHGALQSDEGTKDIHEQCTIFVKIFKRQTSVTELFVFRESGLIKILLAINFKRNDYVSRKNENMELVQSQSSRQPPPEWLMGLLSLWFLCCLPACFALGSSYLTSWLLYWLFWIKFTHIFYIIWITWTWLLFTQTKD